MPHTLHIGPIALVWRFDDADPRWRPFREAYAAYLDDGPGQLAIDAEIGDGSAAPSGGSLPNSLIRDRAVRGSEFDLAGGLVRGALSGADRCRCTIDPLLLSGQGLRVLEQFFYLLFYQAAHAGARSLAEAPFLLHSSAALGRDGVHLFCGPAGAGKSTAIETAGARPVLTDEAAVIVPGAEGPRIEGSPINPFFGQKVPGAGPLAGVYLLEHASRHRLAPAPCAEAVPRLTPEVMVPLGLLETDLVRGMARALDCALALCATGRVRRLGFRPDAGFWSLLEPAGGEQGR